MSNQPAAQQPGDEPEPLHMFDGIAEMDYNPPRWLMAALAITVLWSAWYVAHYHIGTAKLGPDKWHEDGKILSELRAANDTEMPDEATLRGLSTAAERIARGKELYVSSECINCHGPDATGKEQGPNLRDRWWIHGSNMSDIARIIKEGANENKMPAQGSKLSNQDIANLAIFIVDLNRQGERPGRQPDPAREKEQPITY